MNNLDPETIEGDYAEAYQRWVHHFNKAKEYIIPFEPVFDAEVKTPNWKALAESLKESQRLLNKSNKNG